MCRSLQTMLNVRCSSTSKALKYRYSNPLRLAPLYQPVINPHRQPDALVGFVCAVALDKNEIAVAWHGVTVGRQSHALH